ncbi:hypothetical protein GCM10009534_66790 [Kribbella sandramycini]|uniref:Uncharacterized protein n=1 Tax=Kribbella sandramycini TaxID=60450 RepID=A0A841SN63_9ACTN|nr:hypothetical protein [Kribbella sandramycini]
MKRAAPNRRVTRNCQGQQAITTDLTPAPSVPASEPVKKKTRSKLNRSPWADDWAHTTVGDPRPCVICGHSALMRDPYTGRPCHLICAKQ